MRRFLIILGHAFANLRRRDADNWVGGGIVISVPAEDLDPQGPLFDVFSFPGEGLFGDKAEKCWEALAMAEEGVCQEAIELLTDRTLLCVT